MLLKPFTCDACPPGRQISEAQHPGYGKRYSAGIADKIIHPNFRPKKKAKGTGLGMVEVCGIVQSLKGALRLQSTPGLRTTVHIHLPAIKVTIHAVTHQAPC